MSTYTVGGVDRNGLQAYTKISDANVLVSIFPFRQSRVPDYQIDTIRIKDHWVVYSNTELRSDQSQIVLWQGKYYSIVYDENTVALSGAGIGYYKAVLHLGVDEPYGVS